MNRIYWVVAAAIVVLAWVVSAALYPGLPSTIPTHWNIHGKLDGYGPKGTIFLMPGTMTLFAWFVLGVARSLSPRQLRGRLIPYDVPLHRRPHHRHDGLYPGRDPLRDSRQEVRVGQWVEVARRRAMVGGTFLFFAMLGNVLGRVRRNFYIGVRVPWTLASERVWNDTHRVAAWLFVACGLAGFVIAIAGLPLIAAFGVLIGWRSWCRSSTRSCTTSSSSGAGRCDRRSIEESRLLLR